MGNPVIVHYDHFIYLSNGPFSDYSHALVAYDYDNLGIYAHYGDKNAQNNTRFNIGDEYYFKLKYVFSIDFNVQHKHSNNRVSSGGRDDYMRNIIFVGKMLCFIIIITCICGCKGRNNEEHAISDLIEYEVVFNINGKKEMIKIKDGEKINKPTDPIEEGFVFVGWYLEDEKFNFNDQVKSDIELTAKFDIKKFFVTVFIDNQKKTIEFSYGESFNVDMLNIDNDCIIDGVYLDEKFTIEYKNSPITSDICLYIKTIKYCNVNIFYNGEILLSEKIQIGSKYSFSRYLYNSKYKESKLYNDEKFTDEFCSDEIIISDKSLYLMYVEPDEYKDINTIIVYGNGCILKAEVKDGEYLQSDFLMKFGNYVSVYVDKEKTMPYSFGPIYNDLVLYTDNVESEEIINPINVTCHIVYQGKTIDSMNYIIEHGEKFSMSYVSRRTDYYLEGIYTDEKLGKKYNETNIIEDTVFYVKARDQQDHDACKITIYSGYSLNTGFNHGNSLEFYREFYMNKGEAIYKWTFRKDAPSGILFPYLMYKDSNEFYKGEEIYEDTEFIIISDGVPKENNFNSHILNINGDMYTFEYYNVNDNYNFSIFDLKELNACGFYKDEYFSEAIDDEYFYSFDNVIYVKTIK